jgi:mannitol/fructose-specific phosphotransferase system IIA component
VGAGLGNETTVADISLGSADTGVLVDGVTAGDTAGSGVLGAGDIAVPVNLTDANATILETGTLADTGSLGGVLGDGTGLGNETTVADISLGSADTGVFVDGVNAGDTAGSGVLGTGDIAVPVNLTDANATILETGTLADTGSLGGVLGEGAGLGNETTVANISLGNLETGLLAGGVDPGSSTGTGILDPLAPTGVTPPVVNPPAVTPPAANPPAGSPTPVTPPTSTIGVLGGVTGGAAQSASAGLGGNGSAALGQGADLGSQGGASTLAKTGFIGNWPLVAGTFLLAGLILLAYGRRQRAAGNC